MPKGVQGRVTLKSLAAEVLELSEASRAGPETHGSTLGENKVLNALLDEIFDLLGVVRQPDFLFL